MKKTILSLAGLSFCTSILAASPLQEARINRIINDVSVLDPAKGARKAALQEVIKDELGVKTGIKSRSELLFQDETLTRLGPDSYFSFKPGTRDMELRKGTMLLQVPKGLGGARIRTAAVTASITGTTIMLENIPGRDLKVLVLEGSLRLSVNGGPTTDPSDNSGGSNPGSTGGSSTAITLIDPNDAHMSGNFKRESGSDLILSSDIAAKKVDLQTDHNLSVSGAILAENLDFDAGRDALFGGSVRAKMIDGKAGDSITFLGPIGAKQVKLRAPVVTATSINATEKLEITGKLRAGGDAILSSAKLGISEGIDASGRQGTAMDGAGAGYHLTLLCDDEIRLDDKPNSINGINADGGSALAGTSLTGGDGGVIDIGTQTAAIAKDVTLEKTISATSGVNGLSGLTGGNGGTVNVVANGTITARSTIKVSDSAASRASRSGGNISLESRKTNGTAIDVSSSAQLLALLSASAPGTFGGQGAVTQSLSAGPPGY